jgi:hypothetical protein
MKELKINHLAVLAGFVVQFVLGFLWYGPFFGAPWMDMVGLDMVTIEANPPGAGVWITNVVASGAAMYLLAWIFVKMNVNTLLKGLFWGALLGFVFVLLDSMRTGMYNGDPYGLAWITGGFSMTGLALGGLILGGWKKYRS